MTEHVGVLLRAWRNGRGLSLEGLAKKAGISKSTLTGWESQCRQPCITELERVLSALELSVRQRNQALQCVQAPRALARLAQEGERPPVGGDLLRALRLRRGLTQAESARRAGVTQGMIAKWERSEDWPSGERMHALCFALQAHPDELSALLRGRFTFSPPLNQTFSYEEFQQRRVGIGYLRYYLGPEVSELCDLRFLALEADLWLLAQKETAARDFLTSLYGQHARHLTLHRRFAEAARYAEKAMERVQRGWYGEAKWADTVIARLMLLRQEGPKQNNAVARLIRSYLPQIHDRAYRAWMYSELGLVLASSGEREQALMANKHALLEAERGERSVSERYFRLIDYVHSLVLLQDRETLHRFLDSPYRAALGSYPDPRQRIFSGQLMLIRAMRAVGDTAGAQQERTRLDSSLAAPELESLRPRWDHLFPGWE